MLFFTELSLESFCRKECGGQLHKHKRKKEQQRKHPFTFFYILDFYYMFGLEHSW